MNAFEHYLKNLIQDSNKKPFKLVNSQKELIKALAKGYTLKETAHIMKLSYYNLQKRTQLLYKKFNVHNRNDLIKKAIEYKFISNKDVSNKFRETLLLRNKIHFNFDRENPKIRLDFYDLELKYIKLYAQGKTTKEIIKELHLFGKYQARCIRDNICYKLSVRSLNKAIIILTKFNII